MAPICHAIQTLNEDICEFAFLFVDEGAGSVCDGEACYSSAACHFGQMRSTIVVGLSRPFE